MIAQPTPEFLSDWLDRADDREDRLTAATLAGMILARQSGKYAERPVDLFDLIWLAEWLMYGDTIEVPAEPLPDNVVEGCFGRGEE